MCILDVIDAQITLKNVQISMSNIQHREMGSGEKIQIYRFISRCKFISGCLNCVHSIMHLPLALAGVQTGAFMDRNDLATLWYNPGLNTMCCMGLFTLTMEPRGTGG